METALDRDRLSLDFDGSSDSARTDADVDGRASVTLVMFRASSIPGRGHSARETLGVVAKPSVAAIELANVEHLRTYPST